ncbi:hypothetical protein J9317_05160 [Metabacillus sp. KIGAM252]|uniref:Uncharacterized protein n=1 Tax=Metabacillus flavus TaxID=2823519 RepID=A0ABS5LBN4_9BACI|nr:hypothetical protein [Metabacillus flavus]MBS2968143.1 hypothetical protein [Metabacillus flavus]
MQRITEFKTTLSPADASSILRKYEESESRLIHEEYHDAGDGCNPSNF